MKKSTTIAGLAGILALLACSAFTLIDPVERQQVKPQQFFNTQENPALGITPDADITDIVMSGVKNDNLKRNNQVENTSATSNASAMMMPGLCNVPFTGPGNVVDAISGGLAILLTTEPDFDNVLDGDLRNFATIGLSNVTGVGAVSLISVKNYNETYPAGRRAGFVIAVENSLGGLLGADILNGLQIRTYLNNQLQETAFVGGGTPIELSLLSGESNKRRVDFLTTEDFDEVELVFTGVANSTLLSEFHIFYAYQEEDGCDYDCALALTTANFPDITASGSCTGVLCGLSDFNDLADVIHPDSLGEFDSGTIILSGSMTASFGIGETIPGGYDVGFVVRNTGFLGTGLLSLELINAITIRTYLGNTLQETFVNGAGLANVAVLQAGINSISYQTAEDFDSVRITFASVVTLLNEWDLFYGFIRPDDDADGFPNCVDRCPGAPDYFDSDGDGTPDDCGSPACLIDFLNQVLCFQDTNTTTLGSAPSGYTWTVLPGNPGPASIDQQGVVSGLVDPGIYYFLISDGLCSDTVSVSYFLSQSNRFCNDPITGAHAVVEDNGDCQLCGNGDAGNVVDGDQSNFALEASLLSLCSGGGDQALISVKDTSTVYTAGTRVGYVLQLPGGLLNAGLLDAFTITTYLDDNEVETSVNMGQSLLAADGIGTSGQQRLSFETTGDFDEVEISVNCGLLDLDLLSSMRIYYAFVEPDDCPGGEGDANQASALLGNSDFGASINYDTTGIYTLACALCNIDSLSNLIDDNPDNATTIDLTVGAIAEGFVSVEVNDTIAAGSFAGFAVRIGGGLLGAGLLDALTITTSLNGVVQESVSAASPLVSLALLSDDSDINYFGFATTLPFNQITLEVDANLLNLGVGSNLVYVYYAFFDRDSDFDGVPDNQDKCCGGNDLLDFDSDGVPDDCDGAPTALSDLLNLTEDVLVNIPVLNNDDFGINGPGTGTITILDQPESGSASVNDGGTPDDPSDDSIDYLPAPNFEGQDSIPYMICDSDNDCDTSYALVVIEGVNDKPIAIDDINVTPANNPATGNVLINDIDPDKDTLVVNTTPVDGPSNGMVTLNEDGTYTYTPDEDFAGEDQFSYEVCDNSMPALCDTATVYIEVVADPAGGNLPPIANADANQTEVNTQIDGDLLANDSDPNGDNLVINTTPVDAPSNGILTINPDGTYSYTPAMDFVGSDTFSYEVCDDTGPLCDTAVVVIEVLPDGGNSVFAHDDALIVFEDGSAGGNLLDNDFDPEGNTLTANTSPVDGPVNGSVVINPDGSYSYTPDPGFSGNDGFTYSVCDDALPPVCDTASVSIAVLPVNDPPVAQDDINQTAAGNDATGNVLTNDSDPDGNDLTVTNTPVIPPANGDLTLNGDGTYTYTPDPGFSGEDVFQYEVCDDRMPAACDTATVFIEVIEDEGPDNNAPVANADANQTEANQPVDGDMLSNDWDFDGDNLIINTVPVLAPTNGDVTINADGTYTYEPNMGFVGEDLFSYEVCDDGTPVKCDTAFVTIDILSDDRNRTFANDDAGFALEGDNVIGNVLDNDDDPEGDLQTVNSTPVSGPSNGTLTLNPDGSYLYEPDPGFAGNDAFVYEVCDDDPMPVCDQATVYITIWEQAICLSPIAVLQGPYDSGTGLMIDSLRSKGLIPLVEPYSSAPLSGQYVHVGEGGGEEIQDSTAVLGTTGANAIVDWVFVELRSKSDSTLVVATRSGLLQRDGDVVDTDGVSPLCFRVPAPDAYFVAVRHRNHLSVMTLLEKAVSYTPIVVDFTAEPLYRFDMSTQNIPSYVDDGIQQMWAGDVVSIGTVSYNAGIEPGRTWLFNLVVNHPNNLFGSTTYSFIDYRSEDILLDGEVSYNGGSNPGRSWLFNQVVGHPGNLFESTTFIFKEQLPED